jgi:hypothetical protein
VFVVPCATIVPPLFLTMIVTPERLAPPLPLAVEVMRNFVFTVVKLRVAAVGPTVMAAVGFVSEKTAPVLVAVTV